jgi:beta-glucosidase/6-phospho-beta-glucosidase/beta-galactosidase
MRCPVAVGGALRTLLLVGAALRGSASATNALLGRGSATNVTFPASFAFGATTSAYAVEGGWLAGGRGLSIWDGFTHTPGRIRTGETGDVSSDHYHRIAGDVQLMRRVGLQYYRFSISWPRLLPSGYGKVNEEAVAFYDGLIDALLNAGIHPVVTLYAWDLPLVLQVERDGWLSEATASAFVEYASLCFARFGDRVKHWITFHEPETHAVLGYARGEHAPGRAARPTHEPYLAGHFMLLAHAYAVARYRTEFKQQRGLISIALNSEWREPASDAPDDRLAAQRSLEWQLGWFADPVFFGDYPHLMRQKLGKRLPSFTPEQSALLRNSTDYFSLQHYASTSAAALADTEASRGTDFYADMAVRFGPMPGAGKDIVGRQVAPFGLYKLVRWVHSRYTPKGGIILTGSGHPQRAESATASRIDSGRVCYIKLYLAQLARAMREGIDVRGYFVSSLMDGFEWDMGTAVRYGLFHVDFRDPHRKRTAKASAALFARLASSYVLTLEPGECNASVTLGGPCEPVLRRQWT